MFSENLQTLDKRKISTGSVGPGGPYGQGVVKNPTMEGLLSSDHFRFMLIQTGQTKTQSRPRCIYHRLIILWCRPFTTRIKASYLLSIKGSSKQLRTVIANVNYVILLYAAQYK
ncbi:hypothetical protein PSTT_05892, partial [Puccinia striiformis]